MTPLAHHAGEQALAPLLLLAGGGLPLIVAIGRVWLADAVARLVRKQGSRRTQITIASFLTTGLENGTVTESPSPPAAPTLADQVSRLYELVAGYHATNLLEVARELGVWEALTRRPGRTSEELAAELGTDPFCTDVLCRTAFSFELLERVGAGWRMAPHFDQILGDPESSFYLAPAARVHMLLGEDYRDYARHFRAGTTRSYQEHDQAFMREVAEALKTLPRIFLDLVLPRLPGLEARLQGGGRVLDVGCGAGWAVIQFAERFPDVSCVGIDVEPYSVDLARRLITERGLEDRCQARLQDVEQLGEDGTFDVATSFLVVHEIAPAGKPAAFAAVARALKPGGSFVIFDEVYPETDAALQTMPARFAALAQWYEVTWGNVVDTRSVLHRRCQEAGLRVVEETTFSRFSIMVAAKD